MAFQLRLLTCPANDCKSLTIYDNSGNFDSYLNPTGYGNPNLTRNFSDIHSLSVTNPDGTVINITSVVGTTVPADGTAIITVTSSDLGYADDVVLSDGIYTITYSITDTDTPPIDQLIYTTTNSVLITCQLDSCLDSKLAAIESTDCNCENKSIKSLMQAYMILKGAKFAASCGQIESAQKQLLTLQAFCSYTECKTCN